MRRRRTTGFSVPTAIEDMRSDYRAARETRFQSRLTGVDPMGTGADYHYRNDIDFNRIRERARDYQRNDGVVGQGVRRLTANVVQDGFTLEPDTGDKALDTELKERWYAWANDPLACSSDGRYTFPQMERLSFQTAIVDGDIFALLLRNGAIQWVEAHRVRTPRSTSRHVVHGILLDEMRRRVECWITKEETDPLRPVNRVGDIRAYRFRDDEDRPQVLQLYEPMRFSQTRGVTALAPVSETIGIHDDLQFATLVKAQTGALIALLRERNEHYRGEDNPLGEITEEQLNGYVRTLEGIGAGLDVHGAVGETLKMFSADVPSAEFFPHATLILTFIAVNLDLPLAVLLLDPRETNFSGWRGAIDQARLRFRQMQQERITQFHQPVYEWKVRQWLALDDALAEMARRSGVNPFEHQWNPPSWRYIEPEKDARGDAEQFSNGLNSLTRIHAARGQDWRDDIAPESVEDVASLYELAIQRADQINQTHRATFDRWGWGPVHYQQLVYLPKTEATKERPVGAGTGEEAATEGADAA
jgi:lambda family phage portal protein